MNKSPEQIYDELLVLKSQDGDRHAFDELIQRWQGRLWRHARQLSDDQEAAADILQESWMAILRGIRRLSDPASFPKWAYRIVSNKTVDWVRQKQRYRKIVNQTATHKSWKSKEEPRSIDAQNDIDQLRQSMRSLSADRRAILSMYYLDGMTIPEIGEALAIPGGTVKSRLFNARQ